VDLITQGLLGAATAQAGSNQREARIAAVSGFLAGMLPDADALIRSPDDALLVLEYHRHFTHSILFIPIGALLAALLLWPFMYKKLLFHKLLLYTLLGISLAGFLDACTTYGTHLLWPFSDERIAWSIIAIVDPVFSLLIAIPLFIGIRQCKPALARLALGLASVYLLFALFQSERALNLANDLIAERGHQPERAVVKPTLANLVLWRSVYQADGYIYVDAVRAGIFAENKIYIGNSLALLTPDNSAIAPADTRSRNDLNRFASFSDGWLAIHPGQPNVVGDIRYAMLPTSTVPLWGIRLNQRDPDEAPQFVVNRTFTPAMRRDFLAMLAGNDL